MFKVVAKDAKPVDPVRDALKGSKLVLATDAEAERERAFAELQHYDQTGREMEAS